MVRHPGLVAFAVLAVACATGDDPPALVAGMEARLVVGDGHVALVSAVPAVLDDRPVSPPSASDLRWTFHDADGRVVAEGRAPDPRLVHVEALFGEPGGGADLVAGAGALTVELPDVRGTLRVAAADDTLIGTLALEPLTRDGYTAAEIDPGKGDFNRDSDVRGAPRLVAGSGEETKHFNVLFVPEGYREGELPQFRTAVDAMVAELGNVASYKKRFDRFNFWSQDIRSRESGIGDPQADVAKDTAFDVVFGDGTRVPRRCAMPRAEWDARSVANLDWLRDKVRADVVVVLANTDERAGCARHRDRFIVQSARLDVQEGAEVLAHELGHALFGLADEYEEAGRTCADGPNVASSLDALPWRDLVATGTPLPTPVTVGAGTVGAFTGGGYCSANRWRPQLTCAMRETGRDFCAVCEREMERATTRRKTAIAEVEVVNATGFDVWVRCAGPVSSTCSGYARLVDGTRTVLKLSDGRFTLTTNPGAPLTWRDRVIAAGAATVTVYANDADPLVPRGG